jgi:hypothetical protein
VLVVGQFRLSNELVRTTFIFLIGFEKGNPILMQEDQDGIGNFPREGLITLHAFDTMKDCCIGQVFSLMDISLSDLVIRLIVQVLGSKSRIIDDLPARIIAPDQVLFHQLQDFPPLLVVELLFTPIFA